jgi:hypothetical protein
VRPYVLGGGGLANLELKIEEVDLGDVTADILDEIGVDDASVSKPYIELGGGNGASRQHC